MNVGRTDTPWDGNRPKKSTDTVFCPFDEDVATSAGQYGAVPVVGVGHSCGSLLHMLITSLFPDTPRAANALISYNNRGVSEAIPGFEEFIIPLFSDGDKNGSELMKAMIGVAREQFNGKRFEKVCFGLLGYLSCPHIGSFD